MLKKGFIIVFTLSLLIALAGCVGLSNMPFNGDIEFHEIALTVPTRFIRDSTQSTEDLWMFEHGGYSEVIIIVRNDRAEDDDTALEEYAESMREKNVDSNIIPFLGRDAVLSEYTRDGVFCQEIFFPHGKSFYAVALRGGTREGFQEITNTIKLMEYSAEETQ